MSHENGFPCQCALAGSDELAEETVVGLGAVTHFGLKGDARFHVIHCARFGDDGFVWIELNCDNLHVVAENFVIDFVAIHIQAD